MTKAIISVDLYATAIMTVIFIASFRQYRRRPEIMRYYVRMMLMNIIELVTDCLMTVLESGPDNSMKMFFLPVLYAVNGAVYYRLIMLYIYYVYDNISRKKNIPVLLARIPSAVCVIMATLWLVSAYLPVLYYFDENGFHRGSGYWIVNVTGYLLAGYIICFILHYRHVLKYTKIMTMIAFVICPIICALIRNVYESFSFMAAAISLSLIIVGNFMQMEVESELRDQEYRLSEQKIRVLRSQISPHFLYNVLTTIYYLCGKEPEQAQTALAELSEYLRGNLTPLDQPEPILFTKELEHIRHYVHLEMMRYEDLLNAEYHIEAEHFPVPPLSIQCLVENAIKHGTSKKKEGGTVWISTRAIPSGYEVKVEDDGVGFDTSLIGTDAADSAQHIGLMNAKERLWVMCKGTMDIRSTPGKGTCITVQLPRHFR